MRFKVHGYGKAKHAIPILFQNKTHELDGIETIQCGDVLTIADIPEPQGLLVVCDREMKISVDDGRVFLVLNVGLFSSLDEYRERFDR
ncbi:hypothetical protein A7P99_05405 [Eikenella sp. NML120348]|nr:hypothetical protein A7P99_05405 [Eikenella sp. NML120348]